MLADPPVLVLDEPTTGLDIMASQLVVQAVATARRDDRLILLATHHVHEVAQLADQLLVFRDGRVVFAGAPAALSVWHWRGWQCRWIRRQRTRGGDSSPVDRASTDVVS